NTFESWRAEGIVVLGFDEIEGNRLNPNKVNINIQVLSGMNWFNALIQVKFGNKKAPLKQLHKALRNKSKYVQLDDGTLGILPAAWIEKFSAYFNAGEIAGDDTLHIPKVNFSAVEELYDEEMLDDAVKKELVLYRERLAGFNSIAQVAVPEELNAQLRPYQKEGLNWLNFLDDFNFGGCLADDMGLGKSIQIIAFILLQRTKSRHNTNLLVVPATLIFNWQAEVKKFAPSIRIHTIYGADRKRNIHEFDQYEIILTSYGTLLSDISFLQDYTFNYIFLDESQNIRNIGTQRYRAVRLLKSRNKIAITGTPVENNTFDLYSQLSFACPGLLGSSGYFRNVYSIPIDRFKDTSHAVALQNKTKPFILRRSKQEVAPELPDKTEMVLYCEMGAEQRGIYNAYEKEFRDYISATNGEELKKNPMNTLKGLTRLRQICDSPLLLGRDALPGQASAKIETLLEQIEGKIQGHKILVFSQFVSMLDLIKNELDTRDIRYTYLTGSTRNREAVVNEFQDNPAVKVFLISLKAGGTG
ncbi:MAG TPA: SNF2-related protein, partial [Chitinophagaceae bacterium]|nr:SNF2-related protein [Chitinophagaceae bacterium]